MYRHCRVCRRTGIPQTVHTEEFPLDPTSRHGPTGPSPLTGPVGDVLALGGPPERHDRVVDRHCVLLSRVGRGKSRREETSEEFWVYRHSSDEISFG